MANISSINGNPITVGADGSVGDKQLAQSGGVLERLVKTLPIVGKKVDDIAYTQGYCIIPKNLTRLTSNDAYTVGVFELHGEKSLLISHQVSNEWLTLVAFSDSDEVSASTVLYGAPNLRVLMGYQLAAVPDGAKYAFVCDGRDTSGTLVAHPDVYAGISVDDLLSIDFTKATIPTTFNQSVDGKYLQPAGTWGTTSASGFKVSGPIPVKDGDDTNALYAKLNLPDHFDLVVGDTFELFWKGVVEAVDPYQFNIDVSCQVGSCYKRKYVYEPNVAGTNSMLVRLRDNAGNELDRATVNLVARHKGTTPDSHVNVLCVGDSLLANGQWAYESHRRIAGTGGSPAGDSLQNVAFIGTCTRDDIGYEGYGGWTFNSYNTSMSSNAFVWVTCSHTKTGADQHSVYADANNAQWKIETIEANRLKMIRTSGSTAMPSSGTLNHVSGGSDTSDITFTASAVAAGNPFWDEGQNKVDFASYASRLGVSSIDHCYVLLGWNSTTTPESTYRQTVTTFIDNLLASFPSCKIGIMGLQVPAQDGLGANYGCSWNYYRTLQKVFQLNDLYASIAEDYENVHFINIAGQFDTENNMQEGTRAVNVRNSSTETYQNNGVHPATSGYNQIADAVYRDLTAQL